MPALPWTSAGSVFSDTTMSTRAALRKATQEDGMLAMNPIQFLGTTLLALASSLGAAQGIVAKPITVIVPYSAGGTTDITARIVAQKLSDAGSTAVVDNRAGAGGVIGWSLAAKSPPDGATIVTTDTSFSMSPGLHPKLPFDPRKDFIQ